MAQTSEPRQQQGTKLKISLGRMFALHFALSALNIGLSNITPALELYAPSTQAALAANCFTRQENGHTIHSCVQIDNICDSTNDKKKCPRTVDPTLTPSIQALPKAMLREKVQLLKQYSMSLADDVYSKFKTASNAQNAYTVNPPKPKSETKIYETVSSTASRLVKWKNMVKGLRATARSHLLAVYSKLATPFALTSLQILLSTVHAVRSFVELTLGFSAILLLLDKLFCDLAVQQRLPPRITGTYKEKTARGCKGILAILLLQRLWEYITMQAINTDNIFAPLLYSCNMIFWTGIAMKDINITAIRRDIADIFAACAHAIYSLRAFRTDRDAHERFAEWAATWADQITWCIATGFCESLVDPKAAFLFPFTYMGLIKGRWPGEDVLFSSADIKDTIASNIESMVKRGVASGSGDTLPEDYDSDRPHGEVWEAELQTLIAEGQVLSRAERVREVLIESESDGDWEKILY
ncbi:hypothetical protein AOQ84DRAFT_443678 [Glonium stellatum]|uniref:Uncharacterized protein n=1 Tax=Glonium stellatum TaxID=574774 RepID=A0A8E2JMA8_9PEZI|nr:hypothetical protein AOQ84DRAFT_443678 [Glonium stellatum]